MSFTEEQETTDKRDAFLTAWRSFFPTAKLPDTDFLQFCGCGSDSSNDHVLRRFNLCKERLDNAINEIKREGFILKWLTEVLNVTDSKKRDLELDKVVNLFFPSTLNQASTNWHEQEDPKVDSSIVVIQVGGDGSEFYNSKEVCLLNNEDSNLLNVCNLNEESKQISKETEARFPLEESELDVDGNVDGSEKVKLEFGFNNKQGNSGSASGELFSEENNEFDEEKSLLLDDINVAEGNKLSANDNTEKGSENDVRLTRTNYERIPTGSSEEEEIEEMEDESHESNSPEGEKPAGIRNRTFATVFSPLAKGINKARLKGKRHLARSSGPKHKRLDSHESTTSGDDVDLLNHSESKTFEKLDSEGLLDNDNAEVHVKPSNDICAANQESMAADSEGCLVPSYRIDRDLADFTRQGTSENNALEKKDMNSQEGRCEEGSIEESPDVIIKVVDELISYLETIEVVSSDELEGESPPASELDDFMLFGGVIRPRKPLRSRRQLDSVLSAGNVSLMSADSCVSPWAIDVAASEMQSADSSEQEDNACCDSSEARPSEGTSPSLPSVESSKQPTGSSTPPPVRPPRRSKTERRSRTLDSPKTLGTMNTDDDEVFGKDDKGYEGKYW